MPPPLAQFFVPRQRKRKAPQLQAGLLVIATAEGRPRLRRASAARTQLTASIATGPGVSLPAGVEFLVGFLDFTITGLTAGAATTLTIAGLDPSTITDYYKVRQHAELSLPALVRLSVWRTD